MSAAPAAPIPLDQIDITQLSVPEQSGAVPLDAVDFSQVSLPGVPLEQVDANALKTSEQWLTGLPRNRLIEEAQKARAAGQDITPFRRAYVERAREGAIIDDDRSGENPGPQPGFLRRGWNGIGHLFEGGFKVVDNVTRALGTKGLISGVPSPGGDIRERERLFDEVIAAIQVGTGSSLNDVRQGVISVANKVYRKGENSPWDNEAFNEQFDADLKAAEWIETASRGGKLKDAGALDPEAVREMAPAADASMLLPVGVGFKAARGAAPMAAATLKKTAVPTVGAEVLAGTARTTASAVRKTQKAVDESPVLHGIVAAGATSVVGGDAGQAMLAGLLGANVKSLGIAKATLGRGATALEKTSDQLLGKLPPGPIGAFAASAARAVKPELKGAALGQLANTPFLLGSQSEEEFKDLLATGLVGHAMGSGAGHVLNGLSISRNYFAPGDRAPEVRLPVKDVGIDPNLDAGHQAVVSKLNNASNNFVQALRDFSRKENGEVYVLDQPSYEKYVDGLVGQPMIGANGREAVVTPEFANVVKRQQGVRLTLPGENGPRQVAISRVTEALPGLSVGHEVGHLFEHTLSPEELAHIQKKTREYYGDEQLVEYHKRYEDLVDPDRDRSNDPQSWEDMSPTEQQNVLSEVFAEHASAVFNSIPVGKFGLNDGAKNYAREVYGMIGRGLEKLGVKQPELSPEGFDPKKTVTGTGIQPSMRLSTLIENAIQAKRLDGELPKTVPSAPAPKVESTSASEPANVRPVEPKTAPKGFKKGDPIGDLKNADGVLVGDEAKVAKENEDGTYEVEYSHPDTGERLIGTVPGTWLESKTTAATGTVPIPAPKDVFPRSPVTPDTPFGSAKVESLPAPKTVENTTRPEASESAKTPATPNLRATPEQQSAVAGPADASVIQKNVATLKAADAQPRNSRPVVETDYYSAKSPISHPDQMVRGQQRLAADAAEVDGQPNPLRTRYQKIFVPYKFRDNANGTQSVFGMSLDKVAQNLDLLKGWLRINPEVVFDHDYLTGSEIASDLQTFLKNQSNGYAGNGQKLSRPADARDITPENPDYTPTKIAPEKAQVLNLLMGLEQPQTETPGQNFARRFAEANGITVGSVGGVSETNSLRERLRGSGFDPRILNAVVENLRVDRITTPLKVRSDLNFPAGDTGIQRAGFMPDVSRVVETPEFKKWFGKSKVVDKNGTPKVLFHGTTSEFSRFDRTNDIGFHFGGAESANDRLFITRMDVSVPEHGENIMPVFVRVENPLRLPDLLDWEPSGVAWALHEAGVITKKQLRSTDIVDRAQVKEWLAEKGYDGIVYNNHVEGHGTDSYIVFDSKQVKSATGNSGEFSRRTGDIRFMPDVSADVTRYNEIQREWKDLVAKGEGGSPRIMELWQENETIKNRHGGMPPVAPRVDELVNSKAVQDVLKDAPMREITDDAPRGTGNELTAKAPLRAIHELRRADFMPNVPVQTERNKKLFRKNDTGDFWLDPHGNLHAISGDHERWAAKFYDSEPDKNKANTEQLLGGRWAKISSENGTLFVTGRDVAPEQKAALDRIGTEFEKDVVVRDAYEVGGRDVPLAQFMPTPERVTKTPEFKKWFGESKVVDEDGKPKVVFHGSRRPDRIDARFRKRRATSGPMAFFTDSPEIASNYSTNKADTSLETPDDYAGWFKYKAKGARSGVPIDRAWWSLTPEERQHVIEQLPKIGYENPGEGSGEIVGNASSIMGKDGIDWPLKDARGNGLRALVEIWLNSGALFDSEQGFMNVLAAAGLDMSRVTFDSPWASAPAVFPVYLSIKNPLDTADIPPAVVEILEKAGSRKRAKEAAGGIISGREWLERLHDDVKDATTHAWTSIPDWVTETLQDLGYDGIKDTGGKMGGDKHVVWVPFDDTQVKSASGNKGTFDPANPDIRYMPFAIREPRMSLSSVSLPKAPLDDETVPEKQGELAGVAVAR